MSQASHKLQSHDECEKVVHRLCRSCISSIENLIGTLSSLVYYVHETERGSDGTDT